MENDNQVRNRSEAGFSLIEMMIASLVLLVGVLSVGSLIGYSISSNSLLRTIRLPPLLQNGRWRNSGA
jgi:prepilin-type N-terminal cleavage/methylation domain-containing protein